MAAQSPLGKMIERGYARGGSMDLQAIVQEIQGMAGYSDRKAAALVGVHHRTWQRWRKGENPPNILHLLALDQAVRKVRADSRPFRADQLVIKAQGKDGRNRTIRGHQLGFNLAHEAAIERVYVKDGPDAAAREFIRQLESTPPGRDWYAEYLAPMARIPEEEDLLDVLDEVQYEGMDSDIEEYSAATASASW